jgi:hypothetical protein
MPQIELAVEKSPSVTRFEPLGTDPALVELLETKIMLGGPELPRDVVAVPVVRVLPEPVP